MLQIWRIAAEALNKLPQTANRRRLFSWATGPKFIDVTVIKLG
jgi:hypothetical protein